MRSVLPGSHDRGVSIQVRWPGLLGPFRVPAGSGFWGTLFLGDGAVLNLGFNGVAGDTPARITSPRGVQSGQGATKVLDNRSCT